MTVGCNLCKHCKLRVLHVSFVSIFTYMSRNVSVEYFIEFIITHLNMRILRTKFPCKQCKLYLTGWGKVLDVQTFEASRVSCKLCKHCKLRTIHVSFVSIFSHISTNVSVGFFLKFILSQLNNCILWTTTSCKQCKLYLKSGWGIRFPKHWNLWALVVTFVSTVSSERYM